MIVDTSALLAYFDRGDKNHTAVAELIDNSEQPFIVSPYVIAELDYLVLSRHGSAAEQTVLKELSSGAWTLAGDSAEQLAAAATIVKKYADTPIGITDAVNLVLSEQHKHCPIITFDRRHYSILKHRNGKAVTILP